MAQAPQDSLLIPASPPVFVQDLRDRSGAVRTPGSGRRHSRRASYQTAWNLLPSSETQNTRYGR